MSKISSVNNPSTFMFSWKNKYRHYLLQLLEDALGLGMYIHQNFVARQLHAFWI